MPRRPPLPAPPADAATARLDLAPVAAAVERVGSSPSDLIPLLQGLQRRYGYLPEPVVAEVARLTGIPRSRIYGVITFYAQFTTVPQGRCKVCVCQGTACHVRGGQAVRRAVESELGIRPGQTSDDMSYTLETVACLGACSLAPVMTVDGQYFGKLTGVKVSAALEYAARRVERSDDD